MGIRISAFELQALKSAQKETLRDEKSRLIDSFSPSIATKYNEVITREV